MRKKEAKWEKEWKIEPEKNIAFYMEKELWK